MTENKLLNEFLDINKKPLNERGYFYDLDLAFISVNIADEFAIGFAEWCLNIGVYTQFKKTQGINKDLLEIYKKEKGL